MSANGYRLTTTRSNGLMPNSSSCFACSGLVIISQNAGVNVRVQRLDAAVEAFRGNPVTSDTSVTLTPIRQAVWRSNQWKQLRCRPHERFREYFDAFLYERPRPVLDVSVGSCLSTCSSLDSCGL